MDNYLKSRVLKEANHILDTDDTIRKTADYFNVSKSTIYKDMTNNINKIDKDLSRKINDVFKKHNAYKHINGGKKTHDKYRGNQ